MRKNLKNLTLAALFGALVYVATLLIKIPFPSIPGMSISTTRSTPPRYSCRRRMRWPRARSARRWPI